jgi:hypothetical protein
LGATSSFFAEIGQVFAPGGEGFADLGGGEDGALGT